MPRIRSRALLLACAGLTVAGCASTSSAPRTAQQGHSGGAYAERRLAVGWYRHDAGMARSPSGYRHLLVSRTAAEPPHQRNAAKQSKDTHSGSDTAQGASSKSSSKPDSSQTQSVPPSRTSSQPTPRQQSPTPGGGKQPKAPRKHNQAPKERKAWHVYCSGGLLTEEQERIVNTHSIPKINGGPLCQPPK